MKRRRDSGALISMNTDYLIASQCLVGTENWLPDHIRIVENFLQRPSGIDSAFKISFTQPQIFLLWQSSKVIKAICKESLQITSVYLSNAPQWCGPDYLSLGKESHKQPPYLIRMNELTQKSDGCGVFMVRKGVFQYRQKPFLV